MNYRPNLIARSLQNRKTNVVGIAVPIISTLFYPELVYMIESRLAAHKYQTIICSTENDSASEREHIETLLSRRVDAVVLAPVSSEENLDLYQDIHASGLPFILIDRYFKGGDISFVITDNLNAAGEGVRWLSSRCVERLYYVGESDRNQSLDDRLQGVITETGRTGMEFSDKYMIFCPPDRKRAAHKLTQILGRGMKGAGVFLESNRYLLPLLDACAAHGLHVPQDFKAIGFDPFNPEIEQPTDFESLLGLTGPIPIIKQDISQIANQVYKYLIRSLESPSKIHGRWMKKVPAELIDVA
jgi:LacI family transcriptional regulator